MTNTATSQSLRRIGAGHYETRDGAWVIQFHAAQNGYHAIWTAYLKADPNAADSYATLADARDALGAL